MTKVFTVSFSDNETTPEHIEARAAELGITRVDSPLEAARDECQEHHGLSDALGRTQTWHGAG